MASRNNYFCGIPTASTSAVSGGALRELRAAAAAAVASVRLGQSQSAEHKKGAQQLNIFALWSVLDQGTYAAGIRIRHRHSAEWSSRLACSAC